MKKEISNFKLIKKEKLKDFGVNLFHFQHKKLKTDLFWAQNSDKELYFNIGFKTPPFDNSGLNHILEHSVLRGSKKYPFKKAEAFAEVLKKSLATNMNASTYPDKTIYYFSTTNKSEFYKILDIYLDAPLRPKIYEEKKFFRQEGWRRELDEKNKLSYNGVVFNEMKGVFGNPENILERDIFSKTFSDNCYKFESGGNPENILDLNYEKFCSYHKKHYHPSNSHIFFYGDLDIEKVLKKIDQDFFSDFSYQNFSPKITKQKLFKKEKNFSQKYFNAENKKNDILGISFLLPDLKPEELKVLKYVLYIILGKNSSILKKEILDKNLANSVNYYIGKDIIQPFLYLELKEIAKNKIPEIKKIINNIFLKISKESFDKKFLKSLIEQDIFYINSLKLKSGRGQKIYNQFIKSYLYEKNPANFLEPLKEISILKKELLKKNKSIFEKVFEKALLKNNSRVFYILEADKNFDPEKILKDKIKKEQKKLTKEKIKKIKEEISEFEEFEKIIENPKNINLIKPASLKSVSKKAIFPKVYFGQNYLHHKSSQKEISSLLFSFKVDFLEKKDLALFGIFSNLLSEYMTKNKSYSQTDSEKKEIFGNFMSYYFLTKNTENPEIYFSVFISFLEKNKKRGLKILNEFFNEIIFEEKGFENILNEKINSLKEDFGNFGNFYADKKNLSFFNKHYFLSENLSGIDFYFSLLELKKEFKKNPEKKMEEVKNMYEKIFRKNSLFLGHYGFKKEENLINSLNLKNFKVQKKEIKFKKTKKNIAYILENSLSNYNSHCAEISKKYQSILSPLSSFLSYGYLWEKIREKGGAYGSKINFYFPSFPAVSTYRDSRISGSYKDIENIFKSNDLENLSEKEIETAISKKIFSLDLPKIEYFLILNIVKNHLSKIKNKDIQKKRNEIFSLTSKKLAKILPEIRKDWKKGNKVTLGTKKDIKKDKNLFNKIINLK